MIASNQQKNNIFIRIVYNNSFFIGKNNRYGHPNREVLNNLANSKKYRTNQDGSITLKIKNNTIIKIASLSLGIYLISIKSSYLGKLYR